MAVQNSSKKWMLIGGGVIAAAALVVGFQNYPPQPKDAAGTIGGAQRYHEPQITGDDVKVSQDELTKWIQSDTFDRIVKDPEARKLFTDAAVRSFMSKESNYASRQLESKDLNKIQLADESGLDQSRNTPKLEMAENSRTKNAINLVAEGSDLNKIQLADESGLDQSRNTPKLEMAENSRTKNAINLVAEGSDLNKIQLADESGLDQLRLKSNKYPEMQALDMAKIKLLAESNAAINAAMQDSEFCKALLNDALSHELAAYARSREMEPLDSEPK